MSDFGEFLPMPEEMRKHIMEQVDRQEMAADSYRHDVQRMFDEMKKEHLITLRSILHNLSIMPLAAYYEGNIASILHTKYNICPGCGIDHEEQMHNELKEQVSKPEDTQLALFDLLPDEPIEWSQTDLDNMKEYNLDDAWDGETKRFLGFVCTHCGLLYPSIEDRMLRAPDECSGCINKAKWG